MRYLYIDFETGGLNSKTDAPLAFAAMLIEPDYLLTEIARFETAILHPGALNVSPEALAVNGLTKEQIYGSQFTGEGAAHNFNGWLRLNMGNDNGNQVKLMGHNIKFDEKFLAEFLTRYKMQSTLRLFHHSIVDVQAAAEIGLKLSGRLDSVRLVACTEYFGIPHKAHTAMGDVEAGVEVARRLIAMASPKTVPAFAAEMPDDTLYYMGNSQRREIPTQD